MAEVDITNEQRSQLELLAEEYVGQHRAGKAPSIERFISDHPELENDIRDWSMKLDSTACSGSAFNEFRTWKIERHRTLPGAAPCAAGNLKPALVYPSRTPSAHSGDTFYSS